MGNRRSFADHSSLMKLYQSMTVSWDMLNNVDVADIRIPMAQPYMMHTVSPRGKLELSKNDTFLMLFLFPHWQQGHFQWYPSLMPFLTCITISALHHCIGHLIPAVKSPLACSQFMKCKVPSI